MANREPVGRDTEALRILFLVSAHNCLSQRAWIELTELGHEVEVEVVDSAAAMEAAVSTHDPQLIVCPFLKTMIPESIWRTRPCLIVHPGPRGDRGPSSLDWAIELGAREWGVTVLDTIDGTQFHLFGAHLEGSLRGRPGEIVAQPHGAICRATIDGAVWIAQLRRRGTDARRHLKLPAVSALSLAGWRTDAPEVATGLHVRPRSASTFRETSYLERGAVGCLEFEFYNGAMSTEQCERLREAYAYARARRSTRVIVLTGGSDYFSNGIHLGVIEASEDPAEESWRNLESIDDVVRDIIETDSHVVVSALRGDAGAGGVPLALAADYVIAREDAVLNPYYGHMGGLYGSEYWTYLLPRRVGPEMTARLVGPSFTPIGARQALRIGLLDAASGATLESFEAQTTWLAEQLAAHPYLDRMLERKRRRRENDERTKPLHVYRSQELARSYQCFFGEDPTYHEARRRFAYKLGREGVPVAIAKARSLTLA